MERVEQAYDVHLWSGHTFHEKNEIRVGLEKITKRFVEVVVEIIELLKLITVFIIKNNF